jgi:hypothetical protein
VEDDLPDRVRKAGHPPRGLVGRHAVEYGQKRRAAPRIAAESTVKLVADAVFGGRGDDRSFSSFTQLANDGGTPLDPR